MSHNGKNTNSKSFIVPDKLASQGMREKLMTDFLKKKIGIERFEKVERILNNEQDPSALLKNPS